MKFKLVEMVKDVKRSDSFRRFACSNVSQYVVDPYRRVNVNAEISGPIALIHESYGGE